MILKVILAGIVIIIFIGLTLIILTVLKGYGMYRCAIQKKNLNTVVSEVRHHPNFVPLSEMNPILPGIIMLAEDQWFYEHRGYSLKRIRLAFKHNFKHRKILMGGSTITQQLAKNFYFTFDRKYKRKVAELFVVYHLETKYSKDEILELYLNYIFYGFEERGIKVACRQYFGLHPSRMSMGEAISLAAILPHPERFHLINAPEQAKTRRKSLIKRLYVDGFFSLEDAKEMYGAGILPLERIRYYEDKMGAYMNKNQRGDLVLCGSIKGKKEKTRAWHEAVNEI